MGLIVDRLVASRDARGRRKVFGAGQEAKSLGRDRATVKSYQGGAFSIGAKRL